MITPKERCKESLGSIVGLPWRYFGDFRVVWRRELGHAMNQSPKENAGKFRAPRQVVSEGRCFAPVRFPSDSLKPQHAPLGFPHSSIFGQWTTMRSLTERCRQATEANLESFVGLKHSKLLVAIPGVLGLGIDLLVSAFDGT